MDCPKAVVAIRRARGAMPTVVKVEGSTKAGQSGGISGIANGLSFAAALRVANTAGENARARTRAAMVQKDRGV